MSNIFRGQFKRIRWISPDRSWCVAIMEDNSTVCGPPPAGGFEVGAEYILAGRWVENEKFGRQFKHTSVTLAAPVTADGLKAYLKKTCDGIGPAIAQRLHDAFGEKAVETLRTDPSSAAATVKGLSITVAEAAADELNKCHALEAVNIQLSSLLDGYGFRSNVYNDVIERWGVDAARRIRSNPFCLLTKHIPSVGFRRVDKLFCDLYADQPDKINSPKRLAIAAWWTLRSDASGHTWYSINKIDQSLRELGAKDFNVKHIIDILKRAKWVAVREFNEQLYVTDIDRARCERNVANMIADHLRAPIEPYNFSEYGNLTIHQIESANRVLSTPIGILCGTPGTGKTFTLSRIVRDMLNNRMNVAVAAPTGKAAVRCTSAMEACGVDSIATTIHTLLAPRFLNGKMQFTYNAENPLPYDVVIIDESSMLDTQLFRSLLAAMHPTMRLILVGDPYQLPPVGWGQPMNDLIKQGKAGIGELTEVHRNSGAIVLGCQAIKSGNVPKFAERYIPGDPTTNLVIIPAVQEEAILSRLVLGIRKFVERGIKLSDIQVIVPTNAGGKLGRHNINSMLQREFNPNGFQVDGNRFRVEDKAIILKNRLVPGVQGNYSPEDIDEWGEVYVANGDVGTVVKVTGRNTFIKVVHPSRLIRVGPAAVKEEKDEKKKDRLAEPHRDNDGDVDFDLAYGITCHKSQGSGYPYVFVVLDPSYGAMSVASRQWLYTATSRAEQLAVWVGDVKTAKQMIGKIANYRLSFLISDINEFLGEEDAQEAETEEDRMDLPVCHSY